jgi:hypothetical protein
MLQTSFGLFGNRRLAMVQPWQFPYAEPYDATPWPHRELLADIARVRHLPLTGRATLTLATDSPRFNADNLNLAALAARLPFDVSTTAFDNDRQTALQHIRGMSYAVYREGGEAGSPYNTFGADVYRELRESGQFVELPIARRFPDGGIARVFANLWSGRFIQSSTFFHGGEAGYAAAPTCNVIFGGRMRLSGFSAARTADGLRVQFLWHCLRPVEFPWRCFLHALNEHGNAVNLDHEILNGEPPLTDWRTGDSGLETLLIPASDLPGGPFRLRFGLFRQDTGERLSVETSTLPLTDEKTAVFAVEHGPGSKPR